MPVDKKGHTTLSKSPKKTASKTKNYAASSRGVAKGHVKESPTLMVLPGVGAKKKSGLVRRKNLNIDQGLLDKARAALGVKTETEAVELGLGAILELAEFQSQMLAGFDRLMDTGGLEHAEGEKLDFSGFGGKAPIVRRKSR